MQRTYTSNWKDYELIDAGNSKNNFKNCLCYFPLKKVEVSKLAIKSTTGKTIEYKELTRVY
ncbi:MAG: hypothetical protein J5I47_07385 [Vicingus serpentipes]|nr:hypothetical protein [Vicingus serpentipes]